MWVLLRLLTALGVGLFKFFKRRTSIDAERQSGGIPWVYRQHKNKREVTSTRFGVSFAHPIFFRLSRENAFDRWFKAVGFTREFQSRDRGFDEQIYVACDHPAIEPLLQEDHHVRATILTFFGGGATSIYSDGAHLWVHRNGDSLPNAVEVEQLDQLRNALAALPAESFVTLRDRFFWRALLVESVAWSTAFYGFPAIIELLARPEPLYFDARPVIGLGLLTAVGIFSLLLFLSWVLLRGSSRAHRVFVESLLVLAVGVPLTSVEIVSDTNIGLDHSAPREVSVPVTGKYTTTTRSRRGGKRTRYHLQLAPVKDRAVTIPTSMQVPYWTYSETGDRGQIAISIREGALGFPWIAEVKPVR